MRERTAVAPGELTAPERTSYDLSSGYDRLHPFHDRRGGDQGRPDASSDTNGVLRVIRTTDGWRHLFMGSVFVTVAVAATICAALDQSKAPIDHVEIVSSPPALVGLGYLEPESSIVRISASGNANGMGSKVGALLVGEGDIVQAGQVLALLDTAPRLAAQVAAAETQVRLKQVQFQQQRYDLANTIASRRAALGRAQADLAMTQTEYARQRTLVAGNIVSKASYDKAARDYLNDVATIAEMQAALGRLQATTDDAASPNTQIDLAVAQAAERSAEADLATARASLAEATVRAPFAGRILTLKARVGEQIGSDGLLEMGDTDRMRAVIEVYQTDIARVRVGQPVQLRAEALSGPVHGRVERIGAAVQRQTVVNNDPAAATDARVVQVFVALDAKASNAVAGLSRLQVRAVFTP